MDNGSQHLLEPSLVSLLGGIANDAKELLLQEVALTKLEVAYELSKAKTAAIALGIGIGTIAAGGLLLMLMLVHVLAAFTVVPLWGCYGIFGSVLAVLGGVLLSAGKTKAEGLDVVPQRTVEDKGECAMADKADDVRQEIKKGRQDIADSRSAITEKLAILEDRIQETVDGVKHTFDLHYQVKQRPWLMFGGSLLMGYMIGSRSHTSSESSSRSQPKQGTAADTRNHFKSEIASIKNVVFGTVISTLWAMAKQVLLPARTPNNPGQNPVPIPTSKTNGDARYRKQVRRNQ